LPQPVQHFSTDTIPGPIITTVSTASRMPKKHLKTPHMHPATVPPRLASMKGMAIMFRHTTQPPFLVDQRLVCGRPIPYTAGVVFVAAGGEGVDKASFQSGGGFVAGYWSGNLILSILPCFDFLRESRG
jgi:hypothetical protein